MIINSQKPSIFVQRCLSEPHFMCWILMSTVYCSPVGVIYQGKTALKSYFLFPTVTRLFFVSNFFKLLNVYLPFSFLFSSYNFKWIRADGHDGLMRKLETTICEPLLLLNSYLLWGLSYWKGFKSTDFSEWVLGWLVSVFEVCDFSPYGANN